MKKIKVVLFLLLSSLTFAGCSSPAPAGNLDSESVEVGSESLSSDEATADPFGGQCPVLGQPVLDTLASLDVAGAASFEGSLDRLQRQTSEAGYDSIYSWIISTENLIIGPLQSLDLAALTSSERSTIESLISNFTEPGTISYGMDWAVTSANSGWYLDTYSKLISVGTACENYW